MVVRIVIPIENGFKQVLGLDKIRLEEKSSLHCVMVRGSSPKTSYSTTLKYFFKEDSFLPSPRDYERIIAGHNDIKGGSFLLFTWTCE